MIDGMLERVFIRVVGFTDAERHALNTLFRLSQDANSGRPRSYEPWLPDAPDAARLVLIDGSDGTAAQELHDARHNPDAGLIWVGAVSPAHAWHTFSRPLRWPEVVHAMDKYFTQNSALATLDFDIASDALDVQLEAAATMPATIDSIPLPKRALIAETDREASLYLASKMAVMGITHIDQALSTAQTKDFLLHQRYDFVSVDLSLVGEDPWLAVALARQHGSMVLITGQQIGLAARLSAKVNGCSVMKKPLEPSALSQLLQKI